jgi:hypothetical protein
MKNLFDAFVKISIDKVNTTLGLQIKETHIFLKNINKVVFSNKTRIFFKL